MAPCKDNKEIVQVTSYSTCNPTAMLTNANLDVQRTLRPSSLLLLAAAASEDSCQRYWRRRDRSAPSATHRRLKRRSHQAMTAGHSYP